MSGVEQAASYRASNFYGGTFRGRDIFLTNPPWVAAGSIQTAAGATGESFLSGTSTPHDPRLRALVALQPLGLAVVGEDLTLSIELGLVFVRVLADLGTPVGGVYTLLANRSYILTQALDLAGGRIVLQEGTSVRGTVGTDMTLRSTGLSPLLPLISSVHNTYLSDFSIADVGIGVRVTNPPLEASLKNLRFTNVPLAADFVGVEDVFLRLCYVNGGGMRWDGGVHLFAYDCRFRLEAPGTAFEVLPGSTIGERAFFDSCYFEVEDAGATGLLIGAGLICPERGFLLNNTHFEGPGTYVTGLTKDDLRSHWTSNWGLPESRILGMVYATGNASSTIIVQNVPAAITLTSSTLEPVTQRFTHEAALHGLVFQPGKDTQVLADARVTINSNGNNRVLHAWIAVRPAGQPIDPPNDIIASSFGSVETDQSRAMTVSLSTILTLQTDDLVYLAVANTSSANPIVVSAMVLRLVTPAHI